MTGLQENEPNPESDLSNHRWGMFIGGVASMAAGAKLGVHTELGQIFGILGGVGAGIPVIETMRENDQSDNKDT